MTPDHVHKDHERFAEWDAAYVLGALSPGERREFETHLEGCERCRSSVSELTGLPGLLGRLEPSRAFDVLRDPAGMDAMDAASAPVIARPPAELVARIERHEDRRRLRRTRVLIGVAAAAIVAGAIALPVALTTAPHPTVTTVLTPVVSSPLSAQVSLTTVGWGTRLEMNCRYGDAPPGTPESTRWDYELWVVARNGTESELSSWSAKSDSTVNLSAGTSVPVSRIAAVQVRADDGTILLESRLK